MDKTSSRPGPRYTLAGCVMAAALAAGLLSNGYGLLVERIPPTRSAPDWPSFLDGRVTAEIADTLAKTPLPSGSASLERGASWLAVGDLGPRVRRGCPDWLFLADELTPHAGGDAALRARAGDVAQVRARLAAQGIELLVVALRQHRGLLFCTEQLPQVLEVFIHRSQFGLAGEQLDLHAGLADLRQYRRRAHFLGAHQHVRAQAENAFSRQLPLVTHTGQ